MAAAGYAGGAPAAKAAAGPVSQAVSGGPEAPNFPGLGGAAMVDERDLAMFGLKKPGTAEEAKKGTPADEKKQAVDAAAKKAAGGAPQTAATAEATAMSDSAKAMMKGVQQFQNLDGEDDGEPKEDEVKPSETATKLLDDQLEAFTKKDGEEKGREAGARVFGNLLRVLERLQEEPKNTKLHKMRLDVLERILDGKELIPVLEEAGFKQIPDDKGTVIMKWMPGDTYKGDENAELLLPLKAVVKSAQNAADALMDPEKVDFQTVMKLVSANRTLPGIQDVDDKVPERKEPKASEMAKPLKPWEKKAKEAAEKAEAEKKEDDKK